MGGGGKGGCENVRPENNFSKNREREITFTEIRERGNKEINRQPRVNIYLINTYVTTKFDKTIILCGLYHEIRVFACPGRAVTQKSGGGSCGALILHFIKRL